MIRKLLFFLLYITGLPALLRMKMVSKREISILLFHRVSNESDPLWPAMPIKSFEKLIFKLKNTVEIISFNELKSLQSYPTKPVILLSFDDGYVDFLQHVMPLFKQLQIKANHNICPGLVDLAAPPWTQILSLYLSFKSSENVAFNNSLLIDGKSNVNEKMFLAICKQLLDYDDKERNDLIMPLLAHIPIEKVYHLMSWDQINFCSDNNIEIGSHGYMHRNLLQICDSSILENEIIDSSKKIEEKIGHKPIIFAFANAMGNEDSRQFVRKSDYQFSLILMDRLFSWRPIKKEEHTELPRINISRADWREEYLRALGFHVMVKKYFNFF
jgi:peptidoglycan/xylan/chitin deacetylase (PgdA/CDA1 family)